METTLPTFALLVIFSAELVALIFFLGILQNALKRCAPASRTMKPWKVWLTLIPLFGLVWQFFVVLNVGDSLENEFARAGNACRGVRQCTAVGIWMCICNSCVLVPVRPIRELILMVGFVLWIAYWFRIANFTRTLDARPATGSASPIS